MSSSLPLPSSAASEPLPFTNLQHSAVRMSDPSAGFRGLIAKRDIQRGEPIVFENSTFSTAFNLGGKEIDPYSYICSLSPAGQFFFFSIPPNPLIKDPVKSRISQMIPFADREFRLAHFPFIGRAEHACAPNASRQSAYGSTTHEVLLAAAHIRAGDHITISFLGTPLPFLNRRQLLSSLFSINCSCPLCQLPPEERAVSDRRIQQVTDLIESIEELGGSQLMSARGSHGLLQLVREALTIASEDPVIPTAIFSRLAHVGLKICCLLGDEVNAGEWRTLLKDWTRANGKKLEDSMLPVTSDLGFTLMGPPDAAIKHVASALNPPPDFHSPLSHLLASASSGEDAFSGNAVHHKLYPFTDHQGPVEEESNESTRTNPSSSTGRDTAPSSSDITEVTDEATQEISHLTDLSFATVGGAPSSVSDTTSIASTEDNNDDDHGPSPHQPEPESSSPSKRLSQNQKKKARARARKASTVSTSPLAPNAVASSSPLLETKVVAQDASPSFTTMTTTTTQLKQTTSTVSFPSVTNQSNANSNSNSNPPVSPFPFTFASPPPSNDAALPSTATNTATISTPPSSSTTHTIPQVPSSAITHEPSSPKLSTSQKKRAKAKAKKGVSSSLVVEGEEGSSEEEEKVLTSKQRKNLKSRAKAKEKAKVEVEEEQEDDATEVGEEEEERGRGREEKRLDRDRRVSGDGSLLGGEMELEKGKKREVVEE